MTIDVDINNLDPKHGELDFGSFTNKGYKIHTLLRWHPLRKDEPDSTVAELTFSFEKENDAEIKGHLVVNIYGRFRVSYMDFAYDGKKPTGAELTFNNSDFIINVIKDSEEINLQSAYQDLTDTVNLYNVLTQVDRNITTWLKNKYRWLKYNQKGDVEE